MPPGSFLVEAFEAKTARRAEATGQVDVAGQDVPVNLTQAALGIVKGRVLEASELAPLKGWNVTLGQKSSSGLTLGTLQTTSAVDGAFLFPGTSRGTFTLTARRESVNGSASASGGIEREGEIVDVPLLVKIQRPLTGTISGMVLTASGEPAGDRPVEICHPARSCDAPLQLTANHDGTFSLPDVPLGRFRVTAKSQLTQEAGSVQGELSFDGDIASVRVLLGGVSEIHGTVERSGGAPASGVRVELTGQPDRMRGRFVRCVHRQRWRVRVRERAGDELHRHGGRSVEPALQRIGGRPAESRRSEDRGPRRARPVVRAERARAAAGRSPAVGRSGAAHRREQSQPVCRKRTRRRLHLRGRSHRHVPGGRLRSDRFRPGVQDRDHRR